MYYTSDGTTWNNVAPEHSQRPPGGAVDPITLEWAHNNLYGNAVMTRALMNRHNGRVNVLLLDGSVERTPLKRLWALKWHKEFEIGQDINWPEWMQRMPD